ncbi:hypothetical protein ASC99_00020 [Kitasatospora sp. Root107]|nr:hypothetical protein ASC99_00020 [Kitasatospora sp. Root107]
MSTTTRSANGRSTRIETPSEVRCAPSRPCGSWCSPDSSRSISLGGSVASGSRSAACGSGAAGAGEAAAARRRPGLPTRSGRKVAGTGVLRSRFGPSGVTAESSC